MADQSGPSRYSTYKWALVLHATDMRVDGREKERDSLLNRRGYPKRLPAPLGCGQRSDWLAGPSNRRDRATRLPAMSFRDTHDPSADPTSMKRCCVRDLIYLQEPSGGGGGC